MQAKQALEKCLTLWQTIEANNLSTKREAYDLLKWPDTDLYMCPACESTATVGSTRQSDCSLCPISAWTSTDPAGGDDFKCEARGTPYWKWVWGWLDCDQSPDLALAARNQAAEDMVSLIEQELKAFS